MYKQKLLACLMAILAFSAVGCSTQAPSEDEDGTFGTTSAAAVAGWQAGGLLNHPRHSFTLTVLADGKALATGGRGSDMVAYVGYLRSSELYNPTTGAWTQTTGQLTTGRMEHAAVRLPNNEVLVVGGYNDTYLATAERFSPTSGTWSPAGSMQASDGLPRGRSWSTATLLTSGQVVVAGGLNNSPKKQVDIYNTTGGTWTAGPNLLVERWGHAAVPLSSGLLVIGGFQYGEASATNSTELYAGASGGTSTAKGNLLTARGGHTATLLPDGRVLVAGGRNGSTLLTSSEIYDPTSGTWQPTTGAMTTARYKHTATLVNGKVLVAGGVGPNDTPLTSTELYDPSTGRWTSSGALPWARGLHTAVVLDSVRKVLVAGGWGPQPHSPGNGYIRNTALYDTDNVVVCNQPPNTECYEATGSYVNGACTYPYKAAGTPCNDSRSCTATDVCNGAGTCGGTSTCSTSTSYYCANSTDRWKSVGTGVCSTTSTCGSNNSFDQNCRTDTERYCSGSTAVTTSYGGCSGGSCTSTTSTQACRTDTEKLCSGSTAVTRTHGCGGGSCTFSDSNQACRTDTEKTCNGNTAVTTTYTGCSGGSCSSTATTKSCTASPTYQCTKRTGNSNPYPAPGTTNATTYSRTIPNSGCSGGECVLPTVCQHEERCTEGSTTATGTTCVNYLSYTSNADFLTVSYRDVFEREPDHEPAGGGYAWWHCAIGGPCTHPDTDPEQFNCNADPDDVTTDCWTKRRAEVIKEFLRSVESINGRHPELANFDALNNTDSYKRAFITALYKDVLQRTSRNQPIQQFEIEHYVTWLNQLPASMTPNQRYRALTYQIVGSQEYRDRWTQ